MDNFKPECMDNEKSFCELIISPLVGDIIENRIARTRITQSALSNGGVQIIDLKLEDRQKIIAKIRERTQPKA